MSTRDVAPGDWDTHWANFADVAGRDPAQAFRRCSVLDLLTDAGGPRRYLDIASGQGDLAVDVAERWPDADVVGIVSSDKGVEIGSAELRRGHFAVFDLISGAPPLYGFAGRATHATCSEVLEPVDEPGAGLLRLSPKRGRRGWQLYSETTALLG